MSVCQMVQNLNGGLKTGLKKRLFIVQNVWYLNGLPSHVTLPFEYRTPILSGIQMNPVFRCSVSIQMVMNFLWVKELPIVECDDEVDTHVEACPSPHVLLT